MPASIAERIRSLRIANNLSQAALARAAQVDQSAVSLWESGKVTGLRAENVPGLARALGVTTEEVLKWVEK